MSSTTESSSGRKRKRTSLACDSCRHRKVRCDGRDPCATCFSNRENCTYGTDTLAKSKSDIILDVALRSERLLRESFVEGMVSRNNPSVDLVPSPLAIISPNSTENTQRPGATTPNISNAVLSSFHASTTESILAWPHFDNFQSLRDDHTLSVFHLENSRSSLPQRPTAMQPYVSRYDIEKLSQSFSRNINFWYPTMTRGKLRELQQKICAGHLDDSIESCLALLIMALGAASDRISFHISGNQLNAEEAENLSQRKIISELYFDSALKKIYVAHFECTIDAVHCLFFSGLYFAFLQRPVQAWSFISAAATKCRLLILSPAPNSSHEDNECLRRLFWSCYILESDYLAEISALPQSGIAEIESSISLPGEYHTHDSQVDEEKSSLYFLACISIRRLLNRVHNLLYAKDTGASFDAARFPSVVSELDHQLEQWREFLPPDFQFQVDSEPASSQEGAFLRQRYLTCKSVIYRPYLTRALLSANDPTVKLPDDVYENGKRCINACWLHALNLGRFAHTIMIDTWICSLSMASAMLIILAASQTTGIQEYITSEIKDLGPHLEHLLRQWMHIPGYGGVSPNVKRAIELIVKVNKALEAMLGRETNGG
ncbi:hypothetical protein AJ79_03158 [Helicocarpus griseus UAMH5409]|uniref:Zn(2)-C6 fungal-type domain-containing protein n=1 Tax=Helicocarpus griseus UAMH5409 TaxID=1447875 RepID=A0A2B7XYP9_9EURO|nr:hypothetical protein AJ79_03158 [Helicocarpus griseus UAMH5409]